MRKKIILISKILFSLIVLAYFLFLILPLILSPIADSNKTYICNLIEKESGFKVNFEKINVVTTPKLTIGLKIIKTEAFLPNKEKFLQADNFQIKLSILPILLKKFELDLISADNLDIDLKVQRNGKFLIENYIPRNEKKAEKPIPQILKLSDNLPDIKINRYKITFTEAESGKKYFISGDNTKISKFIFNKKVKISGKGKIVLNGKEQLNYDIKVFNKVMPDFHLNDLVFNAQSIEKTPADLKINIISIFKELYSNKFISNVKVDIKTYRKAEDIKIHGLINIDKLSLALNNKKLPDSFILLNFKGDTIELDSDFYTAEKEITHINGIFKTGKTPNVDMSFKSNLSLNNIVEISKSIARIFDVKDLQTLSADGYINADFRIKSNLKKITSCGYFKIPRGSLKYGLYNVVINDINSDISFDDNIVKVKKAGFSILGNPLRIYGTIHQDAKANINIIAEKLSIKSLLLSLGQLGLLKENKFNSGDLSLTALLSGKLTNPDIFVDFYVNNVNFKNIPTNSSVILPVFNMQLKSNKKAYKGILNSSGFKIINPAATIYIPKFSANIEPENIVLNPSNIFVDKINLTASGLIKNYLTDKITLDIKTDGDIKSTLKGTINGSSQKLNLNYSIPKLCNFSIPGFTNSKIQAKGDVVISGPIINPMLKGSFLVPYIYIPDMLVLMDDMVIYLDGPILKGNGTVKRIKSGGLVAQKLSSDFILKGDLFYLKNITGEAYGGKVKGEVIYNIINGETDVTFQGYDMNATNAIAGASGIKNALSGTLGFDTKINFRGIEYSDILKSLKGNFSFKIEEGAFGSVGKLENFLNAQNILANSVMRLALDSITSISTVKNTALFKYIKGDMTFNKGWANISYIKTSGPTMSYFVNGKYNLLNGTTNVVVLGRLSSDVVALLGPIGELSVDKLTSYIPKFGTLTAIIIKSMTTSPEQENISQIPELTGRDKYYKDFKVVFNGGIESKSSVKSFKWLSDADISAIDIKSTLTDVKKQFTDVKKSTVDEVKNTINETKKQFQDAAGEWKNLIKF